MLSRPTKRTITSHLLRVLLQRTVAFGVCAVFVVAGRAMGGHPTEHVDAVIVERATPSAVWTLTDAASYPGCVPSAAWVARTPARSVVVQGTIGSAHREIAFDLAWRLNHNDRRADDVWVLGLCG